MQVGPFVKCTCGKLHVVSVMTSAVAVCPTCHTSLWDLVLGVKK